MLIIVMALVLRHCRPIVSSSSSLYTITSFATNPLPSQHFYSQGAAISSTVSLGISYCACASASSICNACLGSTSPGTSGRRRSVLLLAITVLLSLSFQYSLAPAIMGNESSWWNMFRSAPGLGKRVFRGWTDGCDSYRHEEGGSVYSSGAYHQCVGNAGVYRPTFFSFLFFVIASIATYLRPSLNRQVWPAKYCIFLLLVIASVFMSNLPLFSGLFLHLSRVGATIFIVIQQIIIMDLAYNWNDSWVGRADAADRLEWGSGAKWLRATICVCILVYVLAFTGIGLLYHFFNGCGENTAIITMTLIGIIAVTILQLSGTEGSLLTSSVLSLYTVYLGYSAVSKNPHGVCNPMLAKESDPWGIAIGLVLTSLSLAWTGWSWTADERLTEDGAKKTRSLSRTNNAFRRGHDPLLDLDDPFLEHDDDARPSGIALESYEEDDDIFSSQSRSEIWKLNVILALVSCWVAMSLTGWGQLVIAEEEGEVHNAANPMIGKFNMTMISMSQWIVLILYAWTLVAPRLFPDRDFS
jgi:hypothetical protein